MATPGDENIQQSEDEDLSQELTEKLLHFQDVTGIEDLSRCKTILRQHAWDVAGAVQSTFTENDISNHQTNSFHNTPPPPATSSGLRHRSIAVGPPLPVRRYPLTSTYAARGPRMYPQGFFQWTYYILALPFRFTWTALFDVFRFVWRVFVPNPLLRVTDPRGDIATFINEYEEAYGTRHPVFFRGTYAEAQSESRRQSKYLLVYLHGPDHQDTPDFCLNVLSNEDTIELIQTNCIFWCCSVNKPEGYRVSRALQENTYPFLAMVCQYQGKMTVVGRMEGPLSPQEVIDQVSGIIERFEPVMIAARADRAERDMTQQLRNEQDQAYQESLLQDKEKEEKRRREEEAKKKKIEDEEEKVRRKEEAEEEYIRRKMRCKEELAPEPDSEDSNAIKILLKLPDGSRLTRRFFTTQPVKNIHDFVFCQDSAPRHFQIVTNFPLKIIPGCSTSDVLESEEAGGEMMEGDEVPSSRTQLLTIEEAGIKSAEILFVQSMDNDDSEEETSER